MSSISSLIYETGKAIFEETYNMLPGLVCASASLVSKPLGMVTQAAIVALSVKDAVADVAKDGLNLSRFTFKKVVNLTYRVGITALIAYQFLYPESEEVNFALGCAAVVIGGMKLAKGLQNVREGFREGAGNSNLKIQRIIKGIVASGFGLFSLSNGGKSIVKIFPILRLKLNLIYKLNEEPFTVILRGFRLFSSDIYGYKTDADLAKETLLTLQERAMPGVSFKEEGMLPFSGFGTCSARALDFLARHSRDCSLEEGSSLFSDAECIINFSSFYQPEEAGIVFQSRQAAFDMINVDKTMDGEVLKYHKVGSLGSYNNLKLTPMTETRFVPEEGVGAAYIERDTLLNLKKLSYGFFRTDMFSVYDEPKTSPQVGPLLEEIKELPIGRYLIRGILPADNHKLELKGHSIAFIKSKQGNFIFDPASGAAAILGNVQKYVMDVIAGHSFWFNEYRIYKAECELSGCENIA